MFTSADTVASIGINDSAAFKWKPTPLDKRLVTTTNISLIIQAPGCIFINLHVLPSDLAKYWYREILCYDDHVNLKFGKCLGRTCQIADRPDNLKPKSRGWYFVRSSIKVSYKQRLIHSTVHWKSRWRGELNTFPNLSHGFIRYLFDVTSTWHCSARLMLLGPFPLVTNVPWVRLMDITPQVNNMKSPIYLAIIPVQGKLNLTFQNVWCF